MKISLQANGVAGLKNWEAEVTATGVTIRYGSDGKKPRTQTIPLSACVNNSATEEALKRADAKRKEGYWDVDPGHLASSPPQQPGKPQSTSLDGWLDSAKSNEWF